MKRLTLWLVCLITGIGLTVAQNKQASGTVTDENGEPVIGASVVVKGNTSLGTVTNLDGKFTLNVPESTQTLVVMYIGYADAEVAAATDVIVKLTPDAKSLKEVVVTALGIKRSERSIGYGAASVNAEEIVQARSTDMMSGLAGKIAGVQINTTSSDPGASTSIIIRGISSLYNTNEPMYVVDGVPIQNRAATSTDHLNYSYDFGNGANAINPEDIENISILKGAAATALYGSRAANGVILVTTKSGIQQKGLGLEYNGGLQFEDVLRFPQMQNEFGIGWSGDYTMIENGSWGPRFDGSMQLWGSVYNNSQKLKPYLPLKNNIKDFFDTGLRYSNSLSYNGATDKSDYYVAFSQTKDNGILPGDADTYKRYTLSTRGSHTQGNLKFSTAINYSTEINTFVPTGQGFSMINSLYQMPRDISIVGLKDLNDPFNTPDYYYTPYGITNPYYVLEYFKNESKSDRLFGKIQLDYDFLKDFKATYRIGLSSDNSEDKIGRPQIIYAEGTPNYGETVPEGFVQKRMIRSREINNEGYITWNKDISDFNVNVLAGFNSLEQTYSRLYTSVTHLDIPDFFNISNSSSTPESAEYRSVKHMVGILAQAEINYNNAAYLTLTARNDWSSTLPVKNNSFFYPGITGSFVFTEYMKSIKDILSFGKVRLAWGQTGNDADLYLVYPYYAKSSSSLGFGSLNFPLNGVNAFTKGNQLSNPNLTPEITTEWEAGGNLQLFKGRFTIDASYYDRVTDKQIMPVNMDASTGYTLQVMNIGKISNKGVELLLTAKPIDTRDFGWEVSWNYTKNNNKVISLAEELGGVASLWGFTGGISMDAVVGQPIGMFKAEVVKTDPQGNIIVDAKGFPLAKDDYEYVGNINYDYEMGFGTSFRYKGVTLTADLDIRQGGLLYSHTKGLNYFVGNAIQTTYNDRNTFIVPNSVVEVLDAEGKVVDYKENTTPVASSNIYSYWDKGATDMGRYNLIDRSFIKLRSVTLSWDLPKSWLKNTFLEAVKLSAFGNNLLLWTPQDNTFVDPELSTYGTGLEGKFGEYSSNPSSRKYGFNVMVKF
ncbi:MAG: SusC/RagA family TonB-linked outer membrane protein [Dysgonamonadaceae bacterium]|jgi:TonB-linked SusC/RagA family outer membrane protein|nr:SusC/RagA family TonB-linked outer membrane protein [Dysgonamonadaceae bacterium]